jgi:hypothetical protein
MRTEEELEELRKNIEFLKNRKKQEDILLKIEKKEKAKKSRELKKSRDMYLYTDQTNIEFFDGYVEEKESWKNIEILENAKKVNIKYGKSFKNIEKKINNLKK